MFKQKRPNNLLVTRRPASFAIARQEISSHRIEVPTIYGSTHRILKYPSYNELPTMSGGISVDAAVKLGYSKLLVKLSTALDSQGINAMDIRYHNKC